MDVGTYYYLPAYALYDSLGAVPSQLELADWLGTSHGRGWSDGWPPTPAAKRKVRNSNFDRMNSTSQYHTDQSSALTNSVYKTMKPPVRQFEKLCFVHLSNQRHICSFV